MRIHVVEYLYRHITRILAEFKVLWKNYIYQSFFAAAAILIVFWLLSVEDAVIIASIGSSAFIVFTMPKSITAKSRRIIGGHVTGFLCGVLGSHCINQGIIPAIFIYSLTVGLSIFLMVVLDFEHPPASGTALGVAITGFSWEVMIAVITSAIILSLAHHYMKKYLRDLV
jgi:CBS-domain-containing membrane protein